MSKINSFADLKEAKAQLRSEIGRQETSVKSNPILKITTSLVGNRRSSNPFKQPLSFDRGKLELKNTAENLLSTFLLANKATRKYFVGYTIAKEMIPFAMNKLNDLFKK